MQRHTAHVLILGVSALAIFARTQFGVAQRVRPVKDAKETNRLVGVYGHIPLSFESNTGQTDKNVRFLSRGEGYTLFITNAGKAVLMLSSKTVAQKAYSSASRFDHGRARGQEFRSESLQVSLAGARISPQIEGAREFAGKAHYFVGRNPAKWHTNVPLYESVRIHDVYPGVDQIYYGNQRQLEQDFVVFPGSSPHVIRMIPEGARGLSLDDAGDLVVSMRNGEMRFHKPVAYQMIAGQRRDVPSRYVLKAANEVGFKIGAYDASRTLVIDPVLSYSTYLGGSLADFAFGIAVDAAGNAYVTGETQSLDFPISAGAFHTPTGASGGFVTKLSPSGSLVYSTFLGGSSATTIATGIAIDAQGNSYVTGESDAPDFPTTAGAFQATLPGNTSGFVTKLNSTGSALVYSTYLGGSANDMGNAIAVDSSGNAYVTGQAQSNNFPTTAGAFQTASPTGIAHGFVSKLNSTGTALAYSSNLGGSIQDQGNGIRVDSQGNAFVTGYTRSVDFPVTAGAFQSTQHGGYNAFVTKVNPTGSALVYSTYFGGGNEEMGSGIAIDSAGNAYITGVSDSNDMPTTAGAFRTTAPGNIDAFVAKFNAAGSALVYSTFLGGSNGDSGSAIAVDSSGNAFVFGNTSSTDFPTVNPTQASLTGTIVNTFVTVLNPSGTTLLFSSYLGGTFAENAWGIGLDKSSNAYLAGSTGSTDFPTTPGALQTTALPFENGFVTKISGITCPASNSGDVEGDGDESDNHGHHTHFHMCKSRGEVEFEDHDSGIRMRGKINAVVISGNQATVTGAGTLSDGTTVTFAAVGLGNSTIVSGNHFSISWTTASGATYQSGAALTAGTVKVRRDE